MGISRGVANGVVLGGSQPPAFGDLVGIFRQYTGLPPEFYLIVCMLCASSFQNMFVLYLLGDHLFRKLCPFYVQYTSLLWGNP